MWVASSSGDHTGLAPTLVSVAILTGLALSTTPVLAVIGAARALSITNQNACMGYYAIDRKLVGPAYQDVTVKYKDGTGAQARLIKKVRESGMGNWGQIPIPVNPKIADIDPRITIDWVLVGAPAG